MTLRLAASDYAFPKLEWEQALRLAADLGAEAVASDFLPAVLLSDFSRNGTVDLGF